MTRYDLSDITCEQLQVFSLAASFLSFTKTANQLDTTQSSVSKKIAALERSLGFPLFARWKHALQLTPEGKQFADDCEDILDRLENSILSIRRRVGENHTEIVLAYCVSTYPYHVGAYFNAMHPDMTVRYQQMGFGQMIAALNAGKIDFAFFGEAGITHHGIQPPLSFEQLAVLPLYAVMAESNPLAGRKKLRLSELAGQRFLMHNPEMDPWHRYIVDMCQCAGFTPKIYGTFDLLFTIFMNIRADDMVFVCDQVPTSIPSEFHLVAVPLEEHTSSSNIIWNTINPHADLITDLVKAGRSFWETKGL